MRTGIIVTLALSVVLAACASGDFEEEDPRAPVDEEPTSTAGVHAAAIEYAVSQGQAVVGDLAYVAGPRPETWDRWCGFESDQVPCLALQAMTIDLAAPFDDESRAEVEDALAPMTVEFIEDPAEVILPMDGLFIAPILNDAALLTFGRPIWVEGKVYVPLDGHGKGWLLEATPTTDGWRIEPLALWIA